MRVYLSGEGTTAPPEIVLGPERCFLMISVEYVILNNKSNKRGEPVKPDRRFRRIIKSRRKK